MVKEYEIGSLKEKTPYRETQVKNPDGTTTLLLEFREIGASSLEDDDVMAFIDADGRRMFIGHDEEGAYKYET